MPTNDSVNKQDDAQINKKRTGEYSSVRILLDITSKLEIMRLVSQGQDDMLREKLYQKAIF